MTGIDDRPFDADHHYYEPLDAFTRYLDPAWRQRTVEVADIDGRTRYIVGGRVSHAVTNPTFDPIVPPGCMYGYFRSNPERLPREHFLREREPLPAHYRDRDARLPVMDEQGVSGVWMFPTLGVLFEHELRHDPEAVTIAFRAFNRWVDDDWGLDYQGRIFAAPYIPLVDPEWAVDELQWALERGARVVCMRGAAPTTAVGSRSPAHSDFDAFWGLVNESGITVAVHSGESGYGTNGYADDGPPEALGKVSPLKTIIVKDRAIHDFLAAVICDELFVRFPNVRLATVEYGAGFLKTFLPAIKRARSQHVDHFTVDPMQVFLEHVWINPFWEDDVRDLVDVVGAERVLFGSDWPHAEGLRHPLDYLDEVRDLDDVAQSKIMRDNIVALTERRPA